MVHNTRSIVVLVEIRSIHLKLLQLLPACEGAGAGWHTATRWSGEGGGTLDGHAETEEARVGTPALGGGGPLSDPQTRGALQAPAESRHLG